MLVVGMIPYNLVISLDSCENSLLTLYEYCVLITMLWLLLDFHSFRFNYFFVCLEIYLIKSLKNIK